MSPSINTTLSDDPNMLEPNDTPGRRLRALRESRKLDIERVAAQLHLQRYVVESIEGDQYERLPAPVFVVGYIKNYARLLGADPAPIVAAYRSMVPAREASLGQILTGSDNSPMPSGSSGRWVWVIAILLIGVAAGAATFWIRGQTDSGLETGALALSTKVEDSASAIAAPVTRPDSSRTTTSAPSAPSPEIETMVSAPPESIPLRRTDSPSLANTSSATPETTVPAETVVAADTLASVPNTTATSAVEPDEDEDAQTVAAAEEEKTAPEPASTEVVLQFTGTSWVDVRGANGRVVLNGEMRSGDRRVLAGEPPYKFVIGNTAATQLTVGGRPFDLKGRAQGNVARFSLDPSTFE